MIYGGLVASFLKLANLVIHKIVIVMDVNIIKSYAAVHNFLAHVNTLQQMLRFDENEEKKTDYVAE